MSIALAIAFLAGGGVYLLLQRGMLRLVIGMTLLTHAANLTLLAAGIGAWRAEPIMYGTNPQDAADPLPQAFVLTAIVISMASSAFMVALAALGSNDDTTGRPGESATWDPDDPADLTKGQRKAIANMQTMGRKAGSIQKDSNR